MLGVVVWDGGGVGWMGPWVSGMVRLGVSDVVSPS